MCLALGLLAAGLGLAQVWHIRIAELSRGIHALKVCLLSSAEYHGKKG